MAHYSLLNEDVSGVILAGGLSLRMGGFAKSFVAYQDRPLIAQVIKRFAPQVDKLYINANTELERYLAFGYPVISDQIPLGPLAGILAGLTTVQTPYLAVVPCDAPLLPTNLVSLLKENLGDKKVAVAQCAGKLQPTFLLLHTFLASSIESQIRNGELAIHSWLAHQESIVVSFPSAEAFSNINTPADLKLANKL